MDVLGCPVSNDLWTHWLRLLAPPVQPFFISDDLAQRLLELPRWTRQEFRDLRLPLTFTNTFRTYDVAEEATWVLLLDEPTYLRLPREVCSQVLREQLDFNRAQIGSVQGWSLSLPGAAEVMAGAGKDGLFVWWPSLWAALDSADQERMLLQTLLNNRLPDRSQELAVGDWDEIGQVLPGARALAGTFARESGANCLSTVMGAFGTATVSELWIHPGPFERWLQGVTRPTQEWDVLGTVLVWRDEADQIRHAAVSLGHGWALQKDAQSWIAPRQVVALPDLLTRWETPGWTVTAFKSA